LLWSIALPGFGQFLNGKPIKGIVFVFLEFLINVQSNFNTIIISSFQGDIKKAIEQAERGDFSEVDRLFRLLNQPYQKQPELETEQDTAPLPSDVPEVMVSCSS